MKKFVPESSTIPLGFETADFKVRPLMINDVVKDYDAVMSSVEYLSGVFGPGTSWPSSDLTLEQDLIDLGWHQKEFQIRRSFAFTVMALNEESCLGCVYINPSPKENFDAVVFLWVRQSEKDLLDKKLYSGISTWIEKEWWFDSVAYPGRRQSWDEWSAL
jgi:hypothetical protein